MTRFEPGSREDSTEIQRSAGPLELWHGVNTHLEVLEISTELVVEASLPASAEETLFIPLLVW